MKQIALTFGLLATLLMTVPAAAQTVYVHGGAGLPSSSELNDTQKVGYNAGIGIGFPLTRGLEGVLRGNLDRFENDVQGVGNFVALSGTANVKANAPARDKRWSPYALAGGGAFRLGTEDNYNTEFGLQFGAGLRFQTAPNASLLVEPNYVLVFNEGDNTQYFPIRFGAALTL
jgi:opacity protein-like surface antigen